MRSLARDYGDEAAELGALDSAKAAALAARSAPANGQDGGVPAAAPGGGEPAAGPGAAGYAAGEVLRAAQSAARGGAAFGGDGAGVYAWGPGDGALRALEAVRGAALAAGRLRGAPGAFVNTDVRGYTRGFGAAGGEAPPRGEGGWRRSGVADMAAEHADFERLSQFFERDSRRYGGAFELL